MSTPVSSHKRTHGQFFTVGNPFVLAPFKKWISSIPDFSTTPLLEPFAGANNIVRLMNEAGFTNEWSCFDIDPPSSLAEGFRVLCQDTLASYPQGYQIAITNPPYLARNSAARRGLRYPKTIFDDLYKHALDITLDGTPYVAAIIPESFITAGLFHARLHSVISLTCPMFDDTEHPVCLALFSPVSSPSSDDFTLYAEGDLLGNYKTLSSQLSPVESGAVKWKFNDPNGILGLRGVDGTKEASICFVEGGTIPSSSIKHSSRAVSRISGMPDDINLFDLIQHANRLLMMYRKTTHDVMMTSFKGLRADGCYRRRLDFAAARNLLDHAVASVRSDQL